MSMTTYPASYRFDPPATAIASLSKRWLMVGLVAAIVAIVGGFASSQQFFRGYLIGYMLVLGFSLGAMALLMLGHLTGGNWWMIGRRVMEAAWETFLCLRFSSCRSGLDGIACTSGWTLPMWQPTLRSAAKSGVFERAVLERARGASILRSGICGRWHCARARCKQDDDDSPRVWQRLKVWAAPGILVYGVTITLACTDWIMSLDPTWYSTIFGMFFMISEMLSMMALMIVILCSLREFAPYDRILGPDELHDYGKLMLTFTMVWAYFSFSQWLIIWAGNLPEEITWYLDRIHGGWQTVALALVFCNFRCRSCCCSRANSSVTHESWSRLRCWCW